MKISGFKYQIEQELKKLDLEVKQTASSENWWDNEHWQVVSRFNREFRFFLCFIVDPMYDNLIYEVKATTEFPERWNDETYTIAVLQLSKGNFRSKTGDFYS